MATYYEMLSVDPSASPDEIKRAFRREIAKYHPDKVQHLGREFQEIASERAAELTRIYKTLSEASLRADYDATLKSPASGAYGRDRDGGAAAVGAPTGAGDLVRRAAVARIRQVLHEEFGACEELATQGFDVMFAPPKRGFLVRAVPPRMLARVVAEVDAPAVHDTWARAGRIRRGDSRDICAFLLGPMVAPAGELGRAINEQRRRDPCTAGRVVVVPVSTRTWVAHVPVDAPPHAKALLERLRTR